MIVLIMINLTISMSLYVADSKNGTDFSQRIFAKEMFTGFGGMMITRT